MRSANRGGFSSADSGGARRGSSSSGFSGTRPGSTGFGGGSSDSRGIGGGGAAVVDSGFSGRISGNSGSSGSGDWWHRGGGSRWDGHQHHDGHHHKFHHRSHFFFSFGFHFGFPFGFYGYSYYPFCGYYYPYSYWGYPYYWSYCHYPWYWDWGYSYYTPYYRRVVYETRYVDTVYEPSSTVVSTSYLPPAEVADPKAAETPEAVSARLLSEGDIALRSGDYAAAAESFKAAVAADPSSAIARFALGEALFATGDYHYATFSIKKGLEIDPSWPDADARKERFYGSIAEFETALGRLKDYAAKNPYDVASQFLLGYQCYFSGRFDEAEAAFAKHAAVVGDDAAAKLFTDRIPAKKAAAAAAAEKPAEAKPEDAPKPADAPK